ncbi:MAG: DUF1549 domain-containing protein, partial [Acidobacteria bacterium]|nr:DUF1549 domain-containing protein [Acidobacteriota bacterium]
MRKVRQALLAIACAVSALAGAENVTVRSLRLVPGDPTLWGVNGSQRFLVLASYPDGMQRDVTTQSRLAVSDAKLARVEAAGRIVALADGKFELAAHFAGQVAKTTVTAAGARDPRQFSFARELGGIFTKRGCNSSDCHGSVKGKGGLKLSANALYPQEDYRWIVEGGAYQVLSAEPAGPRIPRIEKKDPEKSLLLLKPTEGLPHGGGRRFSQGSADYLAILNWIKSGAPYGAEADSGSVAIARLEAYPRETVLDRQGSQQLLVTAHLSNGRSEDVTDQVLYTSNNPEVVEVTPEGLVKARKTGEAAVMIRAAGQAISAGFGVIAKPAASYPSVPRRNFIDHLVFEKLRRFNIVPSDLAGDEEFLRRVCLDITGTLPPPARLREFLAAKDPNKRDQVIE